MHRRTDDQVDGVIFEQVIPRARRIGLRKSISKRSQILRRSIPAGDQNGAGIQQALRHVIHVVVRQAEGDKPDGRCGKTFHGANWGG
jgi:hypothetical protein